MKRLGLPALVILIALISLGAPRSAQAATFRVSDTYRFELYNFAFRDNFWEGVFADTTDATTPVPIERMAMTFRIDYFSPLEFALRYRPVASVDFAMLDFEMVIREVAGLSVAQVLTLSDLTSSRGSVTRGGDSANLQIGGSLTAGDLSHSFTANLPDLERLALGSVGLDAWFIVRFGSLKSFDAPSYIVRGNRSEIVDGVPQLIWQSTLLSQSAVLSPVPVPLPAAGLLLAGALVGLGDAARRRWALSGRS